MSAFALFSELFRPYRHAVSPTVTATQASLERRATNGCAANEREACAKFSDKAASAA